jgi:hypothetical protein
MDYTVNTLQEHWLHNFERFAIGPSFYYTHLQKVLTFIDLLFIAV